MAALMPFIAIALALIAAGSIAYIAWALTSDDLQKSIDRNVEEDDEPDESGGRD
ncbi:MAG: hypothetical protein R3288_06860 [Woeseiaceae bacterium]|nr:hypothetical protein [Woeseiaceae bacterium]